jgi:tetratricopeptide (TPR) repeat protein
MVKEARVSHVACRACSGALPGGAKRNWRKKMKLSRPSTSAPDQKSSWLMRLGVLVLVIGVAAFGAIYYQDQHVSAGPSMIGRQTLAAEAAVMKAPNNIGARLELAQVYQSGRRMDDALAQYNIILKADKQNRTALLGSGRVLIAKGDLTAATAAYHKITDVSAKGEFAAADPQLQEAHYFLGSIAVTQGNTKLALAELGSALKIDATDSDSLYLMGVAELKAGQPLLAVSALKQALLFVPTGWCEPYDQLTLAYGRLASASQATYAGAMANFCHKQPAEAKSQLKTLIKLKSPVAVDALLGLALIAETESKNPEAVSWYKQVLTRDRTNVTAISSLTRLGAGSALGKTTPAPKAAGSSTKQGPS